MATCVNILLIEDSPDDEVILRRALDKDGFDPKMERAEDVTQMRNALKSGEWDLVIADYYLPDFSALAVLETLRESGRDIPCVVVSGKIGEEKAAEVMRNGASDYISKTNLLRLGPVIRRELKEAENRREQRATAEALESSRREVERQKMREREVRLMGQLVSGVAHEVRNPLNSIGTLVEALYSEIGEQENLEAYKHHIDQQVKRMSRLMEDLLMMGRPSKSDQFESFDLRALCRDTVELWNASRKASGRKAEFQLESEKEDMTVNGDYERLRNSLVNLLENGASHSPKDSHLTLRLTSMPDNWAIIQIRDRGTGINPDHLERLFDPFFSTRKGGTGLGLGIVRSIVESHDGRIELWNNEDGPGATAEVRLPLRT